MPELLNIARGIKRRLTLARISERPIIIIGSRRGGSTALFDAIASSPGVWSVNEPSAVFPTHVAYEYKKRFLPELPHSQFFGLDADDFRKFETYYKNLLSVRHRLLGGCRNCGLPPVARRVCLKVLNAPWMLDWFLSQFNAHVVFLQRHPASQARSVIRLGWDFAVKAYFNRPEELEKVFTGRQIRHGQDILRRGDVWETAILDWIVGTHHGRTSNRKDLIRIHYEELVTDPADFVENVLVGEMGLKDSAGMLQVLKRPSYSSYMSSQENIDSIKQGNIDSLLRSWMTKESEDDKVRAQAILDLFEVVDYSMEDPMPKTGRLAEQMASNKQDRGRM